MGAYPRRLYLPVKRNVQSPRSTTVHICPLLIEAIADLVNLLQLSDMQVSNSMPNAGRI